MPNLPKIAIQVVGLFRNRDGYDLVIGRESQRIIRCVNIAEIRFAIGCTYASTVFLPSSEVGENVDRLHRLGKRVRTELLDRFVSNRGEAHSTGGWPAFKEAILYTLVRRFRPEGVIETGVAQGVSSTFILEAMQQNGTGHLTSIDLPNFNPAGLSYREHGHRDRVFVKPELGVGWLVPETLRNRWTLLLGPAQKILPTLRESPQIFFHDSLHTYDHMTLEFEWALNHLSVGGFLMSDDIWWNRAFSDFVASHPTKIRCLSKRGLGLAVRIT